MTQRIGILGGTFDPIHIGHLVMASYAIEALNLDTVWFVPAQSPPHKSKTITASDHRVKMCKLAIALDSRFEFCDLDLQGAGPSYTVDLLERIHQRVPDAELVFLIGADSLEQLHTWYKPETILNLALIGCAERPGSTIDDAVRHSVPGLATRLLEFDSPLIELSSTEIRARCAQSLSITYLVTEDVENYIQATGLYRTGR